MSASLGLPVALGMLLSGFQTTTDDWASWGDTRSAIEYSSLLSGWSIDPKNNRITFEAKLPLVAVYVPTSPRRFFLRAELWKAGGAKELHSWDFGATPNATSYPFLKISPNARTEKPFAFTEAGDYELRFWVRDPLVPRGVYITRLEFQVDFLDDPDNQKPLAVLSGPWDEWAYLWFPFGKRESGRPELRIWRRADLSTKPEGDEYTVKVLKNNVLLGVSEPKTVSTFEHARLDFPLTLPLDLGGKELMAKDSLAQVGEYHVLVEKNGKPDAAYSFEVEHRPRLIGAQFSNDPAFKFHFNQRPIESDHEDFIVPRMPSDDVEREGAGDTLWMERMSTVETRLAFNSGTPAAEPIDPKTPLVKPAIVTEPMIPTEAMKEKPKPQEVANLTVEDAGKLNVIPLPMDTTTKPQEIPSLPEKARPESVAAELIPKPSGESVRNPAEETKPTEPRKRTSRSSMGEEAEFAYAPPPRPTVWESHLGLIAAIFAAHIAIGAVCSYKIVKAA